MPGERAFAVRLHFPVHTRVQITPTSPATRLHRRLSNHMRDNLQLAAFRRGKHWWRGILETPVPRVSRQEHPSLNQASHQALSF